jgi:hypothetical protein
MYTQASDMYIPPIGCFTLTISMASAPSTDQKQPPDEVIALDKLLTSNDPESS